MTILSIYQQYSPLMPLWSVKTWSKNKLKEIYDWQWIFIINPFSDSIKVISIFSLLPLRLYNDSNVQVKKINQNQNNITYIHIYSLSYNLSSQSTSLYKALFIPSHHLRLLPGHTAIKPFYLLSFLCHQNGNVCFGKFDLQLSKKPRSL